MTEDGLPHDGTEKFVKYSSVVNDIPSAFTFVMKYLDEVGPFPMIEIGPCFNDSDTLEHFHVSVCGATPVLSEVDSSLMDPKD